VDAPGRRRYLMAEEVTNAMNLQIQNPKAYELAKRLAEERKLSLDDAVIGALEAEVERAEKAKKVLESVKRISADLLSRAKPGGRDMTKDEIDRMWGHD